MGIPSSFFSHAPWQIFFLFCIQKSKKEIPHTHQKVLVPELTSNTSCIKEKCSSMSTTNKLLQWVFQNTIWSREFPTFPGWTIGFDVCRICRLKSSSSLPKITVFYTLGLSLHCPISYRKDQIYRNFCPVIFLWRRDPFKLDTGRLKLPMNFQ